MNAADVLATFGDACELLEYFEKTTKRQQTIIDKPSSTFTRKRPRVSTLLRNKESELNQNLISYEVRSPVDETQCNGRPRKSVTDP